jgi:hypothetical protein
MKTYILQLMVASLLLLDGCANPHFFPRFKPLFPGFLEDSLSMSARKALAKAKTDFELARHCHEPRYAKYVGMESTSQSRIYQGDGYRLTMVDRTDPTETGPSIVLGPCITGGKPWLYDEVDEVSF